MIKEPHWKVHYTMRMPMITSLIVQVTPKDLIIKYHAEGSADIDVFGMGAGGGGRPPWGSRLTLIRARNGGLLGQKTFSYYLIG